MRIEVVGFGMAVLIRPCSDTPGFGTFRLGFRLLKATRVEIIQRRGPGVFLAWNSFCRRSHVKNMIPGVSASTESSRTGERFAYLVNTKQQTLVARLRYCLCLLPSALRNGMLLLEAAL